MTLELGGKNPVFIAKDADMALAARRTVSCAGCVLLPVLLFSSVGGAEVGCELLPFPPALGPQHECRPAVHFA